MVYCHNALESILYEREREKEERGETRVPFTQCARGTEASEDFYLLDRYMYARGAEVALNRRTRETFLQFH